MEVPQKIKNRTAMGSRNSNSGNLCEENENSNPEKIYSPPCSVQPYVQQPRYRNNLSVH